MNTKHSLHTQPGNYYLLLAMILFFIPLNLMALNSDSDKPINLAADSADIDDLKGISIYTGNVVLTQGSMTIKSEKLTIYTDKNRDLEKAVANGSDSNLATFKQRPEGKNTDFHARAKTMIYFLKENKIHLLRKAFLQQDRDTFSGDRIVYDTKKETVAASSKKTNGKTSAKKDRVRFTFQPKKEQ